MSTIRGEYVFIIDRSGSMSGSRIEMAKNALLLFLRSLPVNSKFNVVGFGSSHELYSKSSVDYTFDNLQDAEIKISKMDANLGGTNILAPLKAVMAIEKKDKYPRNIFLLTDGSVGNTHQVLSHI
mmetsp:Transcript_8452/g.7503  ORF Transcript_8452/g.7503 Transcript_8452/m.7503 type:complete len:125 (+) Transcript_8452:355-729(+)